MPVLLTVIFLRDISYGLKVPESIRNIWRRINQRVTLNQVTKQSWNCHK